MFNDLILPKFYPKQIEFLKAKGRYIAFGGSRGGGKSFIMRWKCVLLALNNPGVQILLLRRTLPELRENHLIPLQKLLRTNDKDPGNRIANYKEVTKEFIFPNGARIKLGYCDSENDVLQFQGQAYEVICLEEATHFTEFQFQSLTESNRPSGLMEVPMKPRMYFTMNPGGVGHMWIKRRFIDREYQQSERPEDYIFVPSSVYDNEWLMENDPDYVRMLENLPENRRKMMLYGDWDVFEGIFFEEFNKEYHVVRPHKLSRDKYIYRVLDYGLDMLACYHVAVESSGLITVFHEIYESNLIVSDAAKRIRQATEDLGYSEDDIELTLAPSDLWNRQAQTGKSAADVFYENGVTLTEVNRDRINGWLMLKELMKVETDINEGVISKHARMHIFEGCANLIRCIPLAQYDEKKINDMATEPHEITHSLDAMRYFATYWTTKPVVEIKVKKPKMKWTEDMIEDYYNGSDEIKKRMVSLYGEIN